MGIEIRVAVTILTISSLLTIFGMKSKDSGRILYFYSTILEL